MFGYNYWTNHGERGVIMKDNEEKGIMTNILATIDERRARAEEKRAMVELIAEENKTMMIDPSLLDEFTKEWWNLAHIKILQRRRKPAALARGSSTAATTGGDHGAGGVDGAGDGDAGS
jgi:hypothetical protein